MIIRNLVDIHGQFQRKGMIPRDGWAMRDALYAAELSQDGSLLDIVPITVREGYNRPLRTTFILPAITKRSAQVLPYFLCDNGKYTFGRGKDRAPECFFGSQRLYNKLLYNATGKTAAALKMFFAKWNPFEPSGTYEWDDLAKGNIVFRVDGAYAHEDAEIIGCWDSYNEKDSEKKPDGICAITGKPDVIARVHESIYGVPEALPTGAALTSYNFESACTRGWEQSLNAHIGVKAMKAYTSALNYMTGDRLFHTNVGSLCVVFWTDSVDEGGQRWVKSLLDPYGEEDQALIDGLMAGNAEDIPGIGQQVHIAIIAANGPRLNIMRYYSLPVGKFTENAAAYYKGFYTSKEQYLDRHTSIRSLITEVTHIGKTRHAERELTASLFGSLINGDEVPPLLMQQVMVYIAQYPGSINGRKAEAIYRAKGGEDAVETKSIAYNLGKLIAISEEIEEKSVPNYKIKRTVKDIFFEKFSACPQAWFAQLDAINRRNIRKVKKFSEEDSVRYEKAVSMCIADIGEFPRSLSVKEKGEYALGYYAQRQARYKKKGDNDNKEENKED